jgi:hypothetical protein
MSCRNRFAHGAAARNWAVAAVALGLLALVSPVLAGNGFFRQQAVGGVMIDAQGILSALSARNQHTLRIMRQQALQEVPGDLKQFNPLRKISLRKLEEAIQKHRATEVTPLPDELKYLGGLQEIKYVFVYPEQRDIVLVGPAEGWKVDPLGNLVGLTTERPVLELDDLMVALRAARQGVMSCSIDPTPEGLQSLRQLVRQLKTIGNPAQTMRRIEQALGPQVVSVNGVPASSHFARVMVAADFRMKRLGMNFDPAPIAGLPSFLQMMQAGHAGMSNMLPRWWLAPKADPLLTDGQGLAWKLQDFGVQCKTEQDFLAADGTRKQGVAKGGGVARRWADNFTEKYDELSKKDSVFGQLRNVMQLAVVGALVEKEHLLDRAQLQLPYLLGEEKLETYPVPRQVHTQASFVKKGRNWLISASGGVQMFPGQVAAKTETSDALAPLRDKLAGKPTHWWWN